MVLRYYQWLPLEIEPDYREGYTCDHCHQEFLDGPFYHEESTGTDYCVPCGSSAGFSPESGLVGSLLFSSADSILRDKETNAIVSFAYRIDNQTVGIVFANGSSIVLRLQLNGSIREALSYTIKENAIDTKMRLTSAEVHQRLPWLVAGIAAVFDIEIGLHTLPSIPTSLENTCLVSCTASDAYIQIQHIEGYSQTFDVAKGVEVVCKDSMPMCVFQAEAVDACTKAAARRILSECVGLKS